MKLSKILFVFFLAFLVLFYCKKEQKDTSQFVEVCKKIVECDKSLSQFQDLQKHCINFFSKLEAEQARSLKLIMDCIKTTPCENLSFQSCTIEYIKELQSMIPGTTGTGTK
ncbi:MAG: hypothetical protein NZ853_05420 [Leptospiraceae bacterium]|nr:hypothetical protein [Leptospiraceae bacterium]MDW7976612.1 hypothetical protein [Leptospiraceae bacterium]